MLRRVLIATALALARANDPLYNFEAVPITQLTDDNFESEVTKDLKHLWVVEYYADWCGHCKQFAKGFTKAAENLNGLVKFGAVNADTAKKVMQEAGVRGFPTVKLFLPETSRNPYTGKTIKTSVDYSGPRTAKGVVDAATGALPSKVVAVDDANLDAFKANGTTPKALLLTKKDGTTPLFKSLSVKLAGRMLLGEARDTQAGVVAAMGAASFPALFLLPAAEDAPPTLYEGELKPAALSAFLEEHAGSEPDASEAAAAVEPLYEAVSADNYAELVEASSDTWLLAFGDVPAETLNGAAEALYGQAKVGKAALDAPFGKKLGPFSAPAIAVLPHGDGKASLKKVAKFGVDEAGVKAAQKAALDSLPVHLIPTLTAQMVDQYMSLSMSSDQFEAKAICMLFSDKPTPPPLFRSLSLAFEGKLAFGMVPASDGSLLQRFNIDKAPAILIMYPDDSKPDETGQLKLAGVRYDPRMHGPFRYGYIANFVGGFVQQRLEMLGKKPEGDALPKKEAPAKKDLGPLPELGAANFEEACVKAGGLCAVAMLDGGPDNTNKEGQLEMLTKMRKKRAGGPLSFSWIDATCHTSFGAAFDIYETDLPAFVVFSPTKLKWARAIGAFDAETLGAFGTGVATGRIRTSDLKALPSIEEIDCAALPRGAEAMPEETPLDEDFMAEILEEERKEREAREAELAASRPAAESASAEPPKDKSKMTKLEKLEADVEECSAMDLLCSARREKQVKAVEKERALQDKLKEIAAKKKKKKKKAAKKA